MPRDFQVGGTYQARVESARFTESTQRGTPGVRITYNCSDHGTISDTIWITPGGIDIARKQLNALGATDAQLEGEDFFERVGEWISGAECEIVIGEDEYNGRKRLTVQFVNGVAPKARPGTSSAVAGLFRQANPANVNAKYANGGGNGGGNQVAPGSYDPEFDDGVPLPPDPGMTRKRY